MKTITLSNSESVALVDDEDYEKLNTFIWYLSSTNYARTGQNGNYTQWTMHQMILTHKLGFEIDHIDGNKLNNQKRNLRYATTQQNSYNQGPKKSNKIGYKGVTFRPKMKRPFWSEIRIKGKKTHLGSYSTPEEAAFVYNKAAKQHHGEFAYQNVIKNTPQSNERQNN